MLKFKYTKGVSSPRRNPARRHQSDVCTQRRRIRRRSLELPPSLVSSDESKPYFSLSDLCAADDRQSSQDGKVHGVDLDSKDELSDLRRRAQCLKEELELVSCRMGEIQRVGSYQNLCSVATSSHINRGEASVGHMNGRVSSLYPGVYANSGRLGLEGRHLTKNDQGQWYGRKIMDGHIHAQLRMDDASNATLSPQGSTPARYQHSPRGESAKEVSCNKLSKMSESVDDTTQRNSNSTPRHKLKTGYGSPDFSVKSGQMIFETGLIGKEQPSKIPYLPHTTLNQATVTLTERGDYYTRKALPLKHTVYLAGDQAASHRKAAVTWIEKSSPSDEHFVDEEDPLRRQTKVPASFLKGAFRGKQKVRNEPITRMPPKHLTASESDESEESDLPGCAKLSRVLFSPKSSSKNVYEPSIDNRKDDVKSSRKGILKNKVKVSDVEEVHGTPLSPKENQSVGNNHISNTVRPSLDVTELHSGDQDGSHSNLSSASGSVDHMSIDQVITRMSKGSLTSSESHSTTSHSSFHNITDEKRHSTPVQSADLSKPRRSLGEELYSEKDYRSLIRQVVERDFKSMFKTELKQHSQNGDILDNSERTTRWLRNHSNETSQTTAPDLIVNARKEIDLLVNNNTRTSVYDLTDSVLILIFKRLETRSLCRASSVCKRWNRLCWLPDLWTDIRLNRMARNINSALRHIVARLSASSTLACLSVNTISLNNSSSLSDKSLAIIAQYFPELQRLEMSRCELITGSGIGNVLGKCPNLCFLDVSNCRLVNGINCSGTDIISFGQNASFLQLRYLDMSCCEGLNDSALTMMASCCSFLEYLYLRRCTLLTDKGISGLALHCSRLRELSLNDCFSVGDAGLHCLARACRELRYISLARCAISDATLQYVGEYSSKLKYLNAHDCPRISDEGLAYLCRNFSRLRSLDCGKCERITDQGIHFMAVNCPHLRKLNVKGCKKISDLGLRKLASHCKNLRFLNVQGCEFSYETVIYLRQKCKYCIIEHTKPEFY